MSVDVGRFGKIKEAKVEVEKILKNKQNCFFIHYSCESWINNTGSSHKVTSIAVRRFESAQTESFSIFQTAERLKIDQSQIVTKFNQIEKELLKDFFSFLKRNKHCYFIHWNMRDVNFGFKALEHRYRILGKNPFLLDDNKKNRSLSITNRFI